MEIHRNVEALIVINANRSQLIKTRYNVLGNNKVNPICYY